MEANESKALPAYITSMKNMLFIEKISEERERIYQDKLESLTAAYKKANPFTYKPFLKKEIEKFENRFYGFEISKTNIFKEKEIELNALSVKEINGGLNKSEMSHRNSLRSVVSLGAEAFVVSEMVSDKHVEHLRSEFPHVMSELKQDIAPYQPKGKYGSRAEHEAAVECFKAKNPSILNELKEASTDKNNNILQSECAVAALALFKSVNLVINPTGFLVSKAIKGLMQTPSMKKLSLSTGKHVNRALERAGVDTQSRTYNKIVVGLTVAAAGTLVLATGDPELFVDVVDSLGADIGGVEGVELNSDPKVEEAPKLDETPKVDEAPRIDEVKYPKEIWGYVEPQIIADGAGSVDLPSETLPTAEANPPQINESGEGFNRSNPSTEVVSDNLGKGNVDELTNHAVEEPVSTSNDDVTDSVIPIDFSGNYTIVEGDTLSEIVERSLLQNGVSYNYQLIDEMVSSLADANIIGDPNSIKVGQQIDLSHFQEMGVDVVPEIDSSMDVTIAATNDLSLPVNEPIIEKAIFRHKP
ncbi:MAG: LysM peptidoglycan-binding domain-containing protein [Endozoicomonadaceae bacterium]|nr:LysM peptidoglycan-binding domain-containing protein [Endozoicomonadaceae bacterium]